MLQRNCCRREAFIKEPIIGSIDLKGPITDNLSIHADVAMSFIDTLWRTADSAGSKVVVNETHNGVFSILPYTRLESKYLLPINLDLAVIGKDFYSPLSFATPVDAFFPFGAKPVWAG